ncbi:hypothetical protein MOQ72_41720 [Saccharopolyspora sp. K220]|uniref:hypothetical protein n=1 Tax=Saccharopolyspora soli TaxID=2926618 RepID=UPI001F599F1E|nr:hypothetical protein [Saccharopolyspora soli]MCI2423938.1 hypothetical protein [Saccharopolyspora soli]
MVGTTIHVARQRAPCGRFEEGRRHRESDAAGLVFDDLTYACGCRRTRHEFHDGSVRIATVQHDGKVLADEHSADHEG